MNAFGDEKRKNGGLRRGILPTWFWTFVIGFILGALVMSAFKPNPGDPVSYFNSDGVSNVQNEAIYTTAPYIVERATQTAQAEKTATQAAAMGTITPDQEIDPIYITATYIIDRATQTMQAIATLTAYPTAIPYF